MLGQLGHLERSGHTMDVPPYLGELVVRPLLLSFIENGKAVDVPQGRDKGIVPFAEVFACSLEVVGLANIDVCKPTVVAPTFLCIISDR